MISVSPIGVEPLQGRKVFLERCSPEHAPFVWQCSQNNDFMDLYRLTQNRHLTEEQIRERLKKERNYLPQQLKRIEWVIHLKNNDAKQPIGLTALADYKPAFRRAEFLIGIAVPEYRRAGLALEASLLVMDFAFNQVLIHKLIAYTYGYNQDAQENVVSLGFTQEGFLREHMLFSKHGFVDLNINGLLESEFRHNQRLSRFSKRLLGWDITNKPPPPQVFSKEELTQAQESLNKVKANLNT
jgi:diamine N-acetyltransferase